MIFESLQALRKVAGELNLRRHVETVSPRHRPLALTRSVEAAGRLLPWTPIKGASKGKEHRNTTWNLNRQAEERKKGRATGLHSLAPPGYLPGINADGGGKAIPA